MYEEGEHTCMLMMQIVYQYGYQYLYLYRVCSSRKSSSLRCGCRPATVKGSDIRRNVGGSDTKTSRGDVLCDLIATLSCLPSSHSPRLSSRISHPSPPPP